MILDARDCPLIWCLETLRKLVMVKLFDCKQQTLKWIGPICPTIKKTVAEKEKATAGLLGDQCGPSKFEIRSMNSEQKFIWIRKHVHVDNGTSLASLCAIWLKNEKDLCLNMFMTDTL